MLGAWSPVPGALREEGSGSVSVSFSDSWCFLSQPVDITLAMNERAVAQKKLAENPFDVNAICMLSRAQEQTFLLSPHLVITHNRQALPGASGKHPISALMEICNKRKWSPPEFVLVHHNGPDHRKNFLFKVMLNGSEYQPSKASPTKKIARAMAATAALQAMGELSKEGMGNGPTFTSASS
ncbi:UNVERIFIED_CONTAM: hypothetical protein FKN15_053007 [Acipenser sinensis]